MQSHGLPPRLINSSGAQYIQKTYYITNHKREAIEKLKEGQGIEGSDQQGATH